MKTSPQQNHNWVLRLACSSGWDVLVGLGARANQSKVQRNKDCGSFEVQITLRSKLKSNAPACAPSEPAPEFSSSFARAFHYPRTPLRQPTPHRPRRNSRTGHSPRAARRRSRRRRRRSATGTRRAAASARRLRLQLHPAAPVASARGPAAAANAARAPPPVGPFRRPEFRSLPAAAPQHPPPLATGAGSDLGTGSAAGPGGDPAGLQNPKLHISRW